ncbi:MAG: zinc metalloprotease HtpX [Patescibacteria group bacterium]|nr:zinc metalloprotease HtpX [Patescibacteria group bacterium]
MFKTTLYLSVLTGLLIFVGYLLGGKGGMFVAFLLSLAMNISSYWFSDKIVLAMHGAKQITEKKNKELFEMTRKLCNSAGIPMPKLYIYESAVPNAFATGRDYNHSAVAVSTGLLSLLDQRELRGVIAHELAHIKNRDILISSVAATIGGALSVIVEMSYGLGAMLFPSNNDEENSNPIAGLVVAIIAPIVAMLIQFAISRSREFEADATGAKIANDTQGLSLALAKLHSTQAKQLFMHDQHHAAHMASAHMYIANPLSSLGNLFSTHPPVKERIKKLESLEI